MIYKSSNPLSPTVTVEIDGATLDYTTIHSINISLEENKHDVVVIQLNGITAKGITDYIDAGVRVTATIGAGRSVEFCGYVTYIEPESISSASITNNSIFQRAKVVCFGSSISMKSSRTRVWENASTVSIGRELANRYSFSLEVVKDSFSLPQLIQTKQSDWEFLTSFCKKYGYSVTVHGAHMRIWDSHKALGRRQSFEVLATPTAVTSLQPGSILKFSGTFGYLTPDGKSYNYSVESIDNNGRVVKTTGRTDDSSLMWSGVGSPTKFNSSLKASSNSVHESERMIEAEFKNKLPFNATVETANALGSIPGGVVLLEGYGSNFEGFWYVRGVEHELIGSNCMSKFRISKDFNTTNEAVLPPPQSSKFVPRAKFVDKTWRAVSEGIDIYV
jgi:phage protein D